MCYSLSSFSASDENPFKSNVLLLNQMCVRFCSFPFDSHVTQLCCRCLFSLSLSLPVSSQPSLLLLARYRILNGMRSIVILASYRVYSLIEGKHITIFNFGVFLCCFHTFSIEKQTAIDRDEGEKIVFIIMNLVSVLMVDVIGLIVYYIRCAKQWQCAKTKNP